MPSSHVLTQVVFKDRPHAGSLLADKLLAYRGKPVLILGLARGGVVVARAIAKALGAKLDVLVVKKISSPTNPEFALGAVAPNNVTIVHRAAAHRLGLEESDIQTLVREVSVGIQQKFIVYRKGKRPFHLQGIITILVDDGAATGATMEAAVQWARVKHAGKIVVALPVASADAISLIRPEADECIVYETQQNLMSVGEFYKSFPQVSDQEVIELLNL